jgi:hypothetical protein
MPKLKPKLVATKKIAPATKQIAKPAPASKQIKRNEPTRTPQALGAISPSDECVELQLIFREDEETYLRPSDVAAFFSLFESLYGAPEYPLQIRRLSYASPLEVWLYGVSGALIGAAVLAGGEIDILRGKVRIGMSLGKAIGELRQAFSRKIEQPKPRTAPKKRDSLVAPTRKKPTPVLSKKRTAR